MKRKYSSALVLGVAATAVVAILPGGAASADTQSTTVTFTVAGGALSISAPSSKDLGSAGAGGSVSAQLGTVTVTDDRNVLLANWNASISTSPFQTGKGSAAETIPGSNLTYLAGPAISVVPGVYVAAPVPSVNGSGTVMTGAGAGSNSVSWNPRITVAIPATAYAGDYSGTITHSVS
jgi:hypothetical protein